VSSSPLFAAFDIETTGLVAGVDRIVELAAVLFNAEGTLDTWSGLVDPGMPISPAAGNVNGITAHMVKGQPPISCVLPGFLVFLSKGTPVAHNAPFDVGFLCADIDAGSLCPPAGPVLDTRTLARRAFPGRFSYSLVNLAADLDLRGPEDAHRALADAHTCRRLFLACVAAIAPDGEITVQRLAEASGPLGFAEHAPRQQRTAAILEKARAAGADVEIDYRSGLGATTSRRIRPLSFTRAGAGIAVVALCQLRKANRTFLLDSITAVRPVT
jgi:DNA polymerase-3 subunit epsilon